METTLTSGGRPIRLTSSQPAGFAPVPAILLLHGAGGNLDFWFSRIAPATSKLGLAVFAVHYFDRTGTTRADPSLLRDGKHVPLWLSTIRDTLAHIAALPGVDPGRVALVGISLGAFLALALGTEPACRLRAIVDLSGGLIPPWDAAATAAFPPTLILHGEADPIVPVSNARNLDALLTRLSVSHQLEILPGEGHWFSTPAQLRLLTLVASFLARHL